MKNYLETIIAFGVIISMALGALTYFAKAEDLKFVEQRLDQKIVSDQMHDTKKRIWQLEDRYKGSPVHQWTEDKDKEEYRRLIEEIEQLKQKQESLIKK